MPTPQLTFRLSDADRKALDRIAADWDVDRTAAVRRLIHNQPAGLAAFEIEALTELLVEKIAERAAELLTGGDR